MSFQETPQELTKVEFARIFFRLEFQETFELKGEILLHLRRDLIQAASGIFSDGGMFRNSFTPEWFQKLFDPQPSPDPEGRRRHRKPSPPFAILSNPQDAGLFEPGDHLDLEIVFWGDGISRIGDFLTALQALGRQGISKGQGVFNPVSAFTLAAPGQRQEFWREGEKVQTLAPSLFSASWELDRINLIPDTLFLEFVSPARLISGAKPLFKPTFARIFPFVLRRVTSMLFSHCDFEVLNDPQELIALASRVEEGESRLRWKDWRFLEADFGMVDLGGVVGTTRLSGETLRSIYWVLHLGALMNIGKGASFGAGHYRLTW